jgi:hypothetical protein
MLRPLGDRSAEPRPSIMKHLRRSLRLSLAFALAPLSACGVTSPLATEATTSGDTSASDAGAGDTGTGSEPTGEPDAPPPASPDAGATTDEPDTKVAPPCGTGPGCDPSDFGGETCESLGLGDGRLLCDPTTCTIIVALCDGLGTDTPSLGPPCGTGPGCDPSDLGDETCSSLGMGTGVLACDPVTCLFDTSMCSGGGGGGGTGGGTGG